MDQLMKIRTLLSFIALLSTSLPLAAQTTAFTYQGRLMDGGIPANGSYDILVGVEDAVTNGNPIAGPISVPVTVSNGLFTTSLDFGSAAFSGGDRWIQLAVRTNGAAMFTAIFPRQPLTPVPYTIHSANSAVANGVVAGSINNLSLADGSITSTKLAPGAVSELSTPSGSVSNAVQVTSGSLVGIGTNAPQAALEVASGGSAFFSPSSQPAIVMQITNGQSGGFTNMANMSGMFISDGIAFVGSYQNSSLSLIDISDPTQPVLRSQLVDSSKKPGSIYTNLDYPFGIFVTNHIAYVPAANDNAVNILDVSNPSSPQLLSVIYQGDGQFDHLMVPVDVKLVGNRAYIPALVSGAINVVDVSHPHTPLKVAVITNGVGSITNMSLPRGIWISGTNMFDVSSAENTLSNIEISNPTAPHMVAQESNGSPSGPRHIAYPFAVTVRSNIAYVASGGFFGPGNGGMSIFDVSIPSQPVLLSEVYDGLGAFNLVVGLFSIALQGNTALVANTSENAVDLIDISDPRHPGLIADMVDDSVSNSSPYKLFAGAQNVQVVGGVATWWIVQRFVVSGVGSDGQGGHGGGSTRRNWNRCAPIGPRSGRRRHG